MQLNDYFQKATFWFTQLGFLTLTILAFLFAEERLLADSGYYFIRVINAKYFWIEHNRLILALSQLPVVIGSWIGLKMSWLITVYSLWHVVFFYGIHLVSKHIYGSKTSGPTLVLLMTVGLTAGFFVPMFELYYAAALIILFDAVLGSEKNRLQEYVILTLLALFIASAHFMAVILLCVVIAEHLLADGMSKWKQLVLPAMVVVGTMVFKKFNISDYEQGKIEWFLNGLQNFSVNSEYLNKLGGFLVMHYLDFLFILAVAFTSIITQVKWKEAILLLGSAIVFTVMVTVSDPWFQSNRYQQQVYYPLMFLAVFAFVKFGLNNCSAAIIAIAILLGVCSFGYRTNAIASEGNVFESRLNELKQHISSTQSIPGTKFVVDENVLTYEPNWSYPIESLIFSSAAFEKTVTICTNVDYNHDQNSALIQPEEFIFRRWEVYPINSLNPDYFLLDGSVYQPMADN